MFRSPTPSPFVDRSTFDELTRVISDHKRDCNGIAEQVAQNRKDLGIQFDRIAQLQAQMDNVEVLLKMLLATRPLTLENHS